MSKHRRPHVIGRARSTVIKTAAAMGVATAIAAAAHSVSDPPVRAQATSQPRDDVLEMNDSQLEKAAPQHHEHAKKGSHTPSGLATDSVGEPQAVEQQAEHTQAAGGSDAAQAPRQAAPAPSHTLAVTPDPASSATATAPRTSTPTQPPATQPPASQAPSVPSDQDGDEGQSGQRGTLGGVVGGVVNGVGGIVGGLLG